MQLDHDDKSACMFAAAASRSIIVLIPSIPFIFPSSDLIRIFYLWWESLHLLLAKYHGQKKYRRKELVMGEGGIFLLLMDRQNEGCYSKWATKPQRRPQGVSNLCFKTMKLF